MTRSEVAAKVIEMVSEDYGLDAVEEATNLREQGDSLDCVELLIDLEDTFGIEVDDDTASRWSTVGDVIEHVATVTA